MSKYPVVVYGASGYTGMLIIDWLIDENIPFTAVGRNGRRIKEMMEQRVVRLESATYEIVEVDHTVEALTKAFQGAKVVCNGVGPFGKYGLVVVEAALKAGCHHIDTTGEQGYMLQVKEKFGELFRQAGLLVSPSLAIMSTGSEIACELVLETPGIDALEVAGIFRNQRNAGSAVSVGSTASLFEMFRNPSNYLWDKKLVPHSADTIYHVATPDFAQTVYSLPWGGTSLPIFYLDDSRVRSCIASVAFYDSPIMQMVHELGKKWEAEYRHLTTEQQDAIVAKISSGTTQAMPPRERTPHCRSVDFAVGRGNLSAARATVYGVTPYIATGALQAAAAVKLINGETAKVGFASACKAFGHRYLLGFLQERGLARASVQQL